MPAVTRELSVVYGTRTIGGSTDVLLHGPVSITEKSTFATLTCEFVIQSASEAAFGTLVRAIESDLRTPRARLRVIQGSETLLDLNPSSTVQTGFVQEPDLVKIGDLTVDSGRSRRYRWSVRVELPADLYAQDGRRDSTAVIAYSKARRATMTVTGEYRASGSTTAYAAYVAGIGTYITALQSRYSLTGLVELVSESATSNDTNQICNFSRSYETVPDYVVIYGSRTIGTGGTTLTGPSVTFTESSTHATLSVDFLVTAATEAAYGALVTALGTDLRTPRQRLRLKKGATTVIDWDPSTSTGYLAEPTLTKLGDESALIGLYRFTCVVELPADLYAQDGRRDSTATISYTPGRRATLNITGEYRSFTGTTSAYAMYLAGIGTYVTTLLSRYSLTGLVDSTPVAETATSNDTDQVCTFSRRYERLVFTQAPGLLDHPSLAEQTLTVSVVDEWPESSTTDLKPPTRLSASYSVWVNVSDTALADMYTGTIEPLLVAAIKAQYSGGGVVEMTGRDVKYDLPENRISTQLSLIAWSGDGLLEYKETLSITQDKGEVLLPIWSAGPHDRYRYQGSRTTVAIIAQTWKQTSKAIPVGIAGIPAVAIPAGGLPGVELEAGGTWVLMGVDYPTISYIYQGKDKMLSGINYARNVRYEFATTAAAPAAYTPPVAS